MFLWRKNSLLAKSFQATFPAVFEQLSEDHSNRDGIDTVVYDERDFLWWLGAVYAPEEPPELVRDLGVWADEPGETYAALPRYNF